MRKREKVSTKRKHVSFGVQEKKNESTKTCGRYWGNALKITLYVKAVMSLSERERENKYRISTKESTCKL